jgi:hypothetical protein
MGLNGLLTAFLVPLLIDWLRWRQRGVIPDDKGISGISVAACGGVCLYGELSDSRRLSP